MLGSTESAQTGSSKVHRPRGSRNHSTASLELLLGRVDTGSVTGAADVHHGRRVQEAVHDGPGHHCVGEHRAPPRTSFAHRIGWLGRLSLIRTTKRRHRVSRAVSRDLTKEGLSLLLRWIQVLEAASGLTPYEPLPFLAGSDGQPPLTERGSKSSAAGKLPHSCDGICRSPAV